jgi:4-amino-4-deoxy-L-arabinose transferase-like glycosyltransferase
VKTDPTTRLALLLIFLATLFRLYLAATQGMFQDECYYWTWSRHLDLSYVDQGPGIAYFIRLGTFFFGETPLGVRFSSVMLAAGTGWLVYLTARRWFDSKTALWTLIFLNSAPLLFAGGFLATYDIPQVFFWAAALYALTRALLDEKTKYWYAVGALTGLGVLCKVTMLAIAPGVLLLLAWHLPFRRYLKSPHPYLAFGIALLAFIPMILWNQSHEWLQLKHAQGLGSHVRGTLPGRIFGDFLGGQALALGPLLWIGELIALGWAWKKHRDQPGMVFSLALTLPFLLICLLTAARNKLEANWPAPMHLAALMPLAAWFAPSPPAPSLRQGRGPGGWVLVGVSVLMTLFGLFPGALAPLGVTISKKTGGKLNESYGWPQMMETVQMARDRAGEHFVAGTNYKVNAVLAFHLKDKPEVKGLYLGTRRDQFFVWTDPKALVGKNAVLCLETGKSEDPLALARRYFSSVEPFALRNITRPGFDGVVKSWEIYICRDFRGYNPDATANGY